MTHGCSPTHGCPPPMGAPPLPPQVVRMVMRHHEEQRQKEERAKREEQAKLRRVAAAIAKEVKQFWSNVEKVSGPCPPMGATSPPSGYQGAPGD